ncbi:hypothetical protein KZZ52_05285 [Dactylosporangium sp. AC04546]|uniref:hypothetical protein n=1 Tax=Dactylosporangium sp. AC04546 TaxID=2862460 RepID=UPI001EDD1F6D|nr:hypothetical protein [Dactylosporangium sp. AC04546]WVK84826.1 hypothetical protein KZZ52_05285 [Dactylosporangium sp. AC04546]
MTTKRKGRPRPSPAVRGAGAGRSAPADERADERAYGPPDGSADEVVEQNGAGSTEPGVDAAESAGRAEGVGSAGSAERPAEAGETMAGGAEASEAGVTQDSVLEVVNDGPVTEPERKLSPELERRLDLWITVGGLVVVTLLALVLALIEAFFAPFRLNGSGVRIPISLVLALVTNPLLGWFAFTTTGRRLAALLPAGAWCVVWILAAGRTAEGDLLLTEGNWVGLLTLFAGPLAFAVGIYVSALRQRPGNSKPGTLAPRSVDR